MLFDVNFESTMTLNEKEAWVLFKQVVTKFLGNEKDSVYVSIVAYMLQKFKKLGCLMSLKPTENYGWYKKTKVRFRFST